MKMCWAHGHCLEFAMKLLNKIIPITTHRHSKINLDNLKPSWCTFNPTSLFSLPNYKIKFISLAFWPPELMELGSLCIMFYVLPSICPVKDQFNVLILGHSEHHMHPYAQPPSIECHVLQCSKLKPSYEFQFEGLSNFNPLVEGLVQIQDINLRI